ncbi:MAG: hypothetical protein COA82_02370 [Alkaliphilus sp.]|nr:MAG: hypothetical protein COA82_02370 [Alkaliphilus sp.]
MKKKISNSIAFVTVFCGYYVLLHFFDSGTLCFSKNVTGIPCPGCGLTRAFESLIKGDVKSAFYYHPLFAFIPITAVLAVLLRFSKSEKIKKNVNYVLCFIIFLFVMLFLIRLVLYFPDIEPLNFYQEGILPRIFRWASQLF